VGGRPTSSAVDGCDESLLAGEDPSTWTIAAALAHRFGLRPWQVRVLFVASCLLPGPQILLYLALWIILPSQ
jgi:hypothetical protein